MHDGGAKSQVDWVSSMHMNVLLPCGWEQENPIGQQVSPIEELRPHICPGGTVFRQLGKLYWMPDVVPAY